MAADQHTPAVPAVTDEFLLRGAIDGDETALRALMSRHDRLVRYAIFQLSQTKCARDPQWLDTVAADAWTGFIKSVRQDGLPNSIQAFLVRIAKYRCISALRRKESIADDVDLDENIADQDHESPLDLVARIEQLEALRDCIDSLPDEDRKLADQLDAITSRKWRLASEALQLPESTLRSRWKQVLARLGDCVRGKTEKQLARSDHWHD